MGNLTSEENRGRPWSLFRVEHPLKLRFFTCPESASAYVPQETVGERRGGQGIENASSYYSKKGAKVIFREVDPLGEVCSLDGTVQTGHALRRRQ